MPRVDRRCEAMLLTATRGSVDNLRQRGARVPSGSPHPPKSESAENYERGAAGPPTAV